MKYELICRPCRNFNILACSAILDPADGLEKVVLSNFSHGCVGSLIFISPDTGQGDAYELPGDSGAWALFNMENEALLVGTCPQYGYLHRFDLRRRAWSEPLRDKNENYIWNFCRGAGGMIYGGTYPGCVLLRYDPSKHTLENMGRMSDNEGNLYSRFVHSVPGHVLVECGMAERHLALWNERTHEKCRFGRPGAAVKAATQHFICTDTNGELEFYDSKTFAPLEDRRNSLPPAPAFLYRGVAHWLRLRDGRVFAVRGQNYFISSGAAGSPPLLPIPVPRPATAIHTIIAAPDGKIWGACGFGQTIFRCDPKTGEYWNSDTVCDTGGEVYGMAFAGSRLFMSAYAGGDHIVYDPSQLWDQLSNRNPRTLTAVGPALVRPAAKSVIGPDGHFWTGWMARYGVYGGGLSRVDVATGDVKVWPDPVPGQALISLTADERFLYFTTCTWGNGLRPRPDPVHFVVWDAAKGEVYRRRFASGEETGQILAVAGRVLVCVGSSVEVFNPARMEWEYSFRLKAPCNSLITLACGRALLFCGKQAWLFDANRRETLCVGDLPGPVFTAAQTPDGSVYFAQDTGLCRLAL